MSCNCRSLSRRACSASRRSVMSRVKHREWTNFPSAKVAARVDEDMLRRAVLRSKSGLVVLQGLAAQEPREDVGDDVLVDVEVCDWTPDVLLGGVAEQFSSS